MLKEKTRKQFAERLVAAAMAYHQKRDKNGIATLIAKDFDVSVQTAAKWVRTATAPKPERWPEIAMKYKVSVAWLTGSATNTPEVVAAAGVLDQSHVAAVGEAVRMALPLIVKFAPEATPEQMAPVLEEAYRLICGGHDERFIKGQIAGMVVELEPELAK